MSKACSYGIRAAIYIAAQEDREFVSIREISEKLNISFYFLAKILRILTQSRILQSYRGPRGGVALARPADSVSLYEIVNVIDGPELFTECILGLDRCGDANPCPLHLQWEELRDHIKSRFQETYLSRLSDRVREEGFRLTDMTPS
jgi:Rrf2 family iron-sulfur cluster assembly transcriptional regulator